MNLIYSCVFFQEKYIELLEYLLKSLVLLGGFRENTKYLILCEPNFKGRINYILESLDIEGDIMTFDLSTLLQAGYARLKIFEYPKLLEFDKVLYLDTDILVTSFISRIFDLKIENKLYALEEGHTASPWKGIEPGWWGGNLFSKDENPNVTGINSGMLLFPPTNEIKNLFENILVHIEQDIKNKNPIHPGLDQPYINYHAMKNGIYDNTKLSGICVNNAYPFNIERYELETVTHFPVGGPGNFGNKLETIYHYLKHLLERDFHENIKVEEKVYKQIIQDNIQILNQIDYICRKSGEPVEGNCFTEDLNVENKLYKLLYKQMNHFSLGKISQNIMEIGFNAGHSTLLYLLSNPTSKITLFDLCDHRYTMECFQLLDSLFPNRLQIYKGDSRVTIPKFIKDNPSIKFDLIHIDGGHFGNTPTLDFIYSYQMSNGYIIFDDTNLPNINEIFENLVLKIGNNKEIKLYDTFIYQHRILQKNVLLDKKFSWEENNIHFQKSNKILSTFGYGKYEFIGDHLVKLEFIGKKYILKFDRQYDKFIAINTEGFGVIQSNFKKD